MLSQTNKVKNRQAERTVHFYSFSRQKNVTFSVKSYTFFYNVINKRTYAQ